MVYFVTSFIIQCFVLKGVVIMLLRTVRAVLTTLSIRWKLAYIFWGYIEGGVCFYTVRMSEARRVGRYTSYCHSFSHGHVNQLFVYVRYYYVHWSTIVQAEVLRHDYINVIRKVPWAEWYHSCHLSFCDTRSRRILRVFPHLSQLGRYIRNLPCVPYCSRLGHQVQFWEKSQKSKTRRVTHALKTL